jgi:hypothetical protein
MEWTNLAGFLLVVVPSLMAATHLVAWGGATLRRSLVLAEARRVLCEALLDDPAEQLREDQRHEAKPYASHEEWRADLWSGDIETAVYRAQKGVPPKPDPEEAKKAKERLATLNARIRRDPEADIRTRMDTGITKIYPEVLIAGAFVALMLMK